MMLDQELAGRMATVPLDFSKGVAAAAQAGWARGRDVQRGVPAAVRRSARQRRMSGSSAGRV